MALDGILLSKIIPGISACTPMRIQKIYQISSTEILFNTHGPAGKKQLLVSCHSVYNRLLFTKRSYPTPAEPGNFVMVLRKYLEGAVIESVEQAELDRWCTFHIRRHNEIGDIENIRLVVELMGKYANVILISKEGKIIDALKRIPPFENNRRTVHPGAVFEPTPSQQKKNPYTERIVDPNVSLTKQFSGFSPFLAKECEYRMAHGQSFSSIMDEISSSTSLYVANEKNEAVFHCIPLTMEEQCVSFDISEGFDVLYYHKEEKERIKQISGDIYHFASRSLKHHTTKLPRLLKEYDSAMDCAKYRLYGDLLYTYNITDTKGMREITLKSFEDDSDVRIPLDPKLDGRRNAEKCYQRYTKLKKGQIYLQEQIALTEQEIAYFKGLLEQLDQADFDTAEEIREELVRLGYLKDKSPKGRRKKKKETGPKITTITAASGIRISFGRNNLQNDALTWHTARKNEIWMHAKDYHGAHVVIHDEHPDEATMRLAANIAAWYSAGRQSSSVPVNYCPVRSLKKIPGAKPGMVQLGSYRTIYIDPEAEELRAYHLAD